MNENNHHTAKIATEGSRWGRFWSRFASAPDPSVAHKIYERLVQHARFPVYFRELSAPDTPEGRFEILALHVGLAVRKLSSLNDEGRANAQALFDLMVTDLDVNMRELGVGDLSVGKQVKRLAAQFYARLTVLDEAFGQGHREVLVPMLRTNVYGSSSPSPESVAHLAEIVAALEHALDRQISSDLNAGRISLPDEQTLIDLADRQRLDDPSV